ncbi:MAG: sulfurtransferase [Acidobacteria bacterium]|nr:MAG: sulfurtransferase [Acidobacteriota bacterium]
MRHTLQFAPLAIALATLGSAAPLAQSGPASPRDGMLVTTAWVASHLKDPNLVLLHVGDPADYPAKHIADARLVSLNGPGWAAPRAPGALALELPSAEELRATLAALGISDNSKIVVYQAKKYFSPSMRVILTLNWAGLGANTVLMDGGLDVWEAEGRPTTSEMPVVKPGTLAPLRILPIVASLEDVQKAQTAKAVKIIDARDKAFYDGTQEGGNAAARNRGHIPGALSVPFSSVYADDGKLKSDAELQTIFKDAGVEPGDTVITYCHIGQQATSTLFAARAAGFNVKLYDGSMDEWSLKKLPVETTIKK